MTNPPPLSKLRIVARDGDRFLSYAKADLLDDGSGLLLYEYYTRTKTSRHSDGWTWSRTPGSGSYASPSTGIPFSQIRREVIKQVPIPSDATNVLPEYRGDLSAAMVFSSTVLNSNGTFCAEVVDQSQLQPTLDAWQHHPAYVSSQTWRPTGTGKAVILTVMNQRST